jgi:acetyl esterase/lipase
VIVLPGGGYTHHAAHEGEPVAEWLRSLGIEASVLLYPVRTLHPGVVTVIEDAVRAARANGATRVGILGFSAGGHAAGYAAITVPGVDFAILGYPVVSMQLTTHEASRVALLGKDASAELRAATSLDRIVTASSPPFFIWHTAEDATVPVEHAYLLAQSLAANGVAHELHVFAKGRHGLGLAPGLPAAEWTALCAIWLADAGFTANAQ